MNNIGCHCQSNLNVEDDLAIVDGCCFSDDINIAPSLNRELSSVSLFSVIFFNVSACCRKLISTVIIFYLYMISIASGGTSDYLADNEVSICAVMSMNKLLSNNGSRYYDILPHIIVKDISESAIVNNTSKSSLFLYLNHYMNKLESMNRLKLISEDYFCRIKSMLINGSVDSDLCPYLNDYLVFLNVSINNFLIKSKGEIGDIRAENSTVNSVEATMRVLDHFLLAGISIFFVFFIIIVAILYLGRSGRISTAREGVYLLFSGVRKAFLGYDDLPVVFYNRDDVRFL